MLENLKAAMRAKNISAAALARIIGTTEKTVNNKLNGLTEFTLREILLIKQCLFPEYDICYLFQIKEESETAHKEAV